jgi:thioredoxin 1
MKAGQTESVSAEDFEEKVIHAGLPVLVDFHREACLPCQQLAPVIDRLRDAYEGEDPPRIGVYRCEDARLFERLKIQFVPQLILFVSGEDHWIERNIRTERDLKKEIAGILERT